MRGFEGEDFRSKLDAEELRRLLDRAVAASYNGIVVTDPTLDDDPIVYSNAAFERMTGYSSSETLGRNCRFLQADDRDQPPIEGLRKALREGREFRAVLRNYKKTGEMFWNELYVSPVFDEAGDLVNFIGIQNDVTGRKRAEEERDLLLARERLARTEAVAARRRLSFLVEADSTLLSAVGYHERLRKTARLIVPDLADWCLVDVLEEDGSVAQVAAAHADPEGREVLEQLRRRRSFGQKSPGISARVLESGRSELVREVSRETVREVSSGEEGERLLGRLGIASLVSVPLLARGRTLGVITLVSSNPQRLYGREDLLLAESLAHRCALAVDNARLYRERSHIARTLQRSLLPHLPEVEEVEVGVEYLPLGEESLVGGDFYDVIRTDDGALVAVVGDVCGKGPKAASVTALARYTIRAVAQRERSPAPVLADLNRAMLRQTEDVEFCTVCCARLEAAAASGFELVVVRAGHPAPLILRSGGDLERIEPAGRAVGVFEDPGLEEQKLALLPGDAAVFYTDGLTEARSPGGGTFFGEERLAELLRSLKGLSAREMASEIKDAVLFFSEDHPRDDLAVLVLRVPK